MPRRKANLPAGVSWAEAEFLTNLKIDTVAQVKVYMKQFPDHSKDWIMSEYLRRQIALGLLKNYEHRASRPELFAAFYTPVSMYRVTHYNDLYEITDWTQVAVDAYHRVVPKGPFLIGGQGVRHRLFLTTEGVYPAYKAQILEGDTGEKLLLEDTFMNLLGPEKARESTFQRAMSVFNGDHSPTALKKNHNLVHAFQMSQRATLVTRLYNVFEQRGWL